MRKVAVVGMAIAVLLSPGLAQAAQQITQPIIVQAPDGSLYQIVDGAKRSISPRQVSQEELEAIPDAPLADAVTFDGSGMRESPPFEVAPGTYTLNWTAGLRDGSNTCPLSLSLVDAANPVRGRRLVVNELVTRDGLVAGDTFVHGLDGGAYYFAVNSTCPRWTLSLTPS
jgi:hypothetical protein